MSDRRLPMTLPAGPQAEARVRRDFWRLLCRLAGRLPFAEDAVAAFICAADPETPRRVRLVLFGALAYFVIPADMIPDFIAGLGFTDDATVMMAAVTAVASHIDDRHRDRARRIVRQLRS